MSKPSIPKGTRDFSPEIMVKRNYIFQTIKKHFERFGYMPLETPSMENLETLTGKYGDEGDQLIFKILNSGDYLSKVNGDQKSMLTSKQLTPYIAEKALRYDLTVPFARFVVMHQNELTFPFKRFQIQPVWRADRPQKGRYREFYQCDADVVGTKSLLCEVELIQLFDAVLTELKIPVTIKINNRKILAGLAEVAGVSNRFTDMTVVIDKLDKIGESGVVKELTEKEFDENSIKIIISFFASQGSNSDRMKVISGFLEKSETGLKGLEELQIIFDHIKSLGLETANLELDPTLARGLNYYTGAIFEVKARDVEMGSICGGGRYDDLTGIFGLPDVSGVGISFGADRIYDVMSELKLFPENSGSTTQLLFANFGESEEKYCLHVLQKVRVAGINAELYPEAGKMKKQFKYADDKKIPFVAVVGADEIKNNTIALKNMMTGEQQNLTTEAMINFIKK